MKKITIFKIIGGACFLISLTPFLIFGAFFLMFHFGWSLGDYHSSYYDRLPETATEIHEASFDNFPDQDVILKAKISKEEFKEYIESLDLGQMKHGPWLKQQNDPDWWNPSTNCSTIGAQPSSKTGDFVHAKHENGYMYLVVYGF